MKRRIFVAVSISKTLQDKILAWEKRWQSASRRIPVRWLAGKNLHITLVPPWYTEDVEAVKQQLAKVRFVGTKGDFVMAFRRVTYGPDPRHPRLIWAEGEAPREMVALKEKIEKALRVKPERRAFLLHLTIARFRTETFSSFPVKTLNKKVAWRDTVSSFVLMESRLSSAGADYEILESIPL